MQEHFINCTYVYNVKLGRQLSDIVYSRNVTVSCTSKRNMEKISVCIVGKQSS